MPEGLPFQFRPRWRDIGRKVLSARDRMWLEQRDRELEDFLGKHLPAAPAAGGSAGPSIKIGGYWETGVGWVAANGWNTTDPAEDYYAAAIGGGTVSVTIYQPGTYLMVMQQDIWRTSTGADGSYEAGFGLPGSFGNTGYLTYCAQQGVMLAGQDYWFGTMSTVEFLNPAPSLTTSFIDPTLVAGAGAPTESTALLSIVRLDTLPTVECS